MFCRELTEFLERKLIIFILEQTKGERIVLFFLETFNLRASLNTQKQGQQQEQDGESYHAVLFCGEKRGT